MMCPCWSAWIKRRQVGSTRNVLLKDILDHELLYSSVHLVAIYVVDAQ